MRGEAERFWTPERIALVRELAAKKLHDGQISAIVGAHRESVGICRRKHGIPTGYVKPDLANPPEGFLDIAPRMTIADCSRHFGVSTTTGRRWYDKTGVEPAARVYPSTRPKRPAPGAPRPPKRVWNQVGKAPMAMPILRDSTSAGQAQLFLQRFGPVFRASTLNPGATGWIMFNRHVSEEDLIANAHRKGFRSEAMAA